MKKSFNSYEEINKQLEILKIEREISYLKLIESTSNISNTFSAPNILKLGIGKLGNTLGNSKQFKFLIYSSVFKFIIKKLIKRK